MTRFIGIISGSSGSGKTTIASNLSILLQANGAKTSLVDASHEAPAVHLHLKPSIGEDPSLPYTHHSGVDVIPSSAIKGKKKIESVLTSLFGKSHIVLIDNSHLHTDESIIIVNPDSFSVQAALKKIQEAEEQGSTVIGAIISRKKGLRSEVSEKEVTNILNKQVLGTVPEDINVQDALRSQQPLVYFSPASPASQSLIKIGGLLQWP